MQHNIIFTLRYINPSTVSVSLAGHQAVQAAECFHCISVSLRFTQITCRQKTKIMRTPYEVVDSSGSKRGGL